MPNPSSQPKVIKDQFGNLVLAPTGMAAGTGQLLDVGSSATSPAGAAVGGANPDAAKMAGTPNQISAPTILPRAPAPNAARVSTEGTQLRDVLRAEAAQPQGPTAEQADKVAEAARYKQQFGDLGSRVQNLIATAIAPPAATTATAATTTTPTAAPALEAQSTAGALAASLPTTVAAPAAQTSPQLTPAAAQLTAEQQSALSEYAANPTVDAYARAKQALGGVDPNQYISAADSTSIAKQLAGATPDQIHMTDDVLKQMGYDAASVAANIGVNAEALAGMTLEQFQAAVDNRLAAEQGDVSQLRATIDDPSVGPNEREAARRQLSQLGAAGVYASDEQLDGLRQSVADADTVEFNGQQYTVEELLSDDTMSGVITNYLDDPKFAAKLRENEPQFAAYIDQHQAALKELALHTTESAKQFDEVSTANADIRGKLGVAGLDDSAIAALLDAVSPGSSSEYATSKIDLSSYPALAALTDPSAAAKAGVDLATLGKNFAAAGSLSQDVIRDLASKSSSQLAAIGAGGVDDASKVKFQNYLKYHEDVAALDALDTHDPHAIAQYLFGDPNTNIAQVLSRTAPHGPTGYQDAIHDVLDSKPRDGKPDTPEQIAKNIHALIGPQDPAKLADALAPNAVQLLRGGRDAFTAEYKRLGGGVGWYDSRGQWHPGAKPATATGPILSPALASPPPAAPESSDSGGSAPEGRSDPRVNLNTGQTVVDAARDPVGTVKKLKRW